LKVEFIIFVTHLFDVVDWDFY